MRLKVLIQNNLYKKLPSILHKILSGKSWGYQILAQKNADNRGADNRGMTVSATKISISKIRIFYYFLVLTVN